MTAELASAIRDLSQNMGSTDVGPMLPPNTPERRRKAIAMLEADGDLSDNEQLQIIQLFEVHSRVADTYAAISSKDTRIRYARSKLTF